MSVYVDNMRQKASIAGSRPAYWSHLFADTPRELREVARELGLRPEWLQHPGSHREHYDVTETVRQRAIKLGAVEITYPHGTGELLARKREDWRQFRETLGRSSLGDRRRRRD